MTRHSLRRTMLHAALAVGLGLAAVACGDEEAPVSGTDPAASADPSEPPSEPPSETPTPTGSPSGPASPTTSPTASPAPGNGAALLLTAEEMPGINEQTRWQEVGTGPEGPQPTGDCQKFDLVTIGATSALVRRFEAPGTAVGATQVVGSFADEASARRRLEVLKTWRATCKDQLRADVEKVSDLTPVEVPGGEGGHYLVQFGANGAELHEFDGVALVRVGPHVSVVQIDTVSQDYNYPPGQEPAAHAVRAAAAKLG